MTALSVMLTVTHGARGRATVAATTLEGRAGAGYHLINHTLLGPEVLSSHALRHLTLTHVPHLHMTTKSEESAEANREVKCTELKCKGSHILKG